MKFSEALESVSKRFYPEDAEKVLITREEWDKIYGTIVLNQEGMVTIEDFIK
jgi:hypothetical protein